jgi:hypothetical protein
MEKNNQQTSSESWIEYERKIFAQFIFDPDELEEMIQHRIKARTELYFVEKINEKIRRLSNFNEAANNLYISKSGMKRYS